MHTLQTLLATPDYVDLSDEAAADLANQQRLYMTMPVTRPSELMQEPGSDCRHAEGW